MTEISPIVQSLQLVYEQLSHPTNGLVFVNNEVYILTEQYTRNIVDTRLMKLTKSPDNGTINVNPLTATQNRNAITVKTIPYEFLNYPLLPKHNLQIQLDLEKQFNDYMSYKMFMADAVQCVNHSTGVSEDVIMKSVAADKFHNEDHKLTAHQRLKVKKEYESHCMM